MPKILSMEEKLLHNLPPATLASRLMALPAPRRLATLLERNDAEAVVIALPEPDFYLFVKELDPGSASPLLAMARPGQLTHLIDVDCWQGDELLVGKTLAWCEEMLAADETKFLSWLYHADFEFLVALFKKWFDRIEIAGEDDRDYQEESDHLPQSTIDNQYYFSTIYPAHEPLLKYILGYLFENHNGFYLSLLHSVRAFLETEVNELAYRFRRGRLADHAIPDAGEAATIYQPLKPERLARDKVLAHYNDEELAALPSFALALIGQHRDLLATALARVDDPAVRANLKQEMAALANKVVVADALAPDEPESLHQAVDKAAAMVNLGLDLLCDGDPDRATLALAQIYLENLYRCGQTRVTSLRLRLDALLHEGWLRHWPHGLNLFDEPWHEAVDLLMAKTPMLLRQSDGGSAPEDLFRSRTDLAAAEETVTMTEGLEPLFADCRRFWPEGWQQLAHLLLPQGQVHQLNQVTLGTLLLTGAANALRQGTWQTVPLPVASWGETAPLLAPEGMEKILRQHLAELLPDKTAHRAAERYLQPLLLRYREEMGDRHHLPEPQLTPFFLFRAD